MTEPLLFDEPTTLYSKHWQWEGRGWNVNLPGSTDLLFTTGLYLLSFFGNDLAAIVEAVETHLTQSKSRLKPCGGDQEGLPEDKSSQQWLISIL